MVLVLDRTYRSSTKGEVKDIREFWVVLLENLGTSRKPPLIQELTELRKRHIPTRFRLYDKVINVLSDLKKKYKIALVSNCFVGLSDVLNALDLTDFFDEIFLSYEVGVRNQTGVYTLKHFVGLNSDLKNVSLYPTQSLTWKELEKLGLRRFCCVRENLQPLRLKIQSSNQISNANKYPKSWNIFNRLSRNVLVFMG